MKKRIISLFLSVAMLFSLLPVKTFAQNDSINLSDHAKMLLVKATEHTGDTLDEAMKAVADYLADPTCYDYLSAEGYYEQLGLDVISATDVQNANAMLYVSLLKVDFCLNAFATMQNPIIDQLKGTINELPPVAYELLDLFDATVVKDYANVVTLAFELEEDEFELYAKVFKIDPVIGDEAVTEDDFLTAFETYITDTSLSGGLFNNTKTASERYAEYIAKLCGVTDSELLSKFKQYADDWAQDEGNRYMLNYYGNLLSEEEFSTLREDEKDDYISRTMTGICLSFFDTLLENHFTKLGEHFSADLAEETFADLMRDSLDRMVINKETMINLLDCCYWYYNDKASDYSGDGEPDYYFNEEGKFTLDGAYHYIYGYLGELVDALSLEQFEPDTKVLYTDWDNLYLALQGKNVVSSAFEVTDSGSGTVIKLLKDISCARLGQYNETLLVESGKSITLDLNGHKLDRNLKTAVDNGGVIVVNGHLYVIDTSSEGTGTITGGNTTGYGGGIYVSESGTLSMVGGKVCGNVAQDGAGIYVDGNITLGGTAKIKNNTKRTGTLVNDSNLVLASGVTIAIGTDENKPVSGMEIHVQGDIGKVIVDSGADRSHKTYFYTDDSSKVIWFNSGKLKIVKFHTHSWTYSVENNSTLKAHCTSEDCPETADPALVLTAPEVLTYDGSAKAATLADTDDNWAENVGSTFPTITYTAKTGSSLTEGKAVNVGSYIASITAGSATATIDFDITRADITSVTFSTPTVAAAGTPATTLAGVDASANYTGTIAWAPADSPFAYNTAYTATVTLSAKANYKFASTVTMPTGWTKSTSSTDTSLVLTKTFDATAKAKITSITAPSVTTQLTAFTTQADQIAALPTSVTVTVEDNSKTSMAITWALKSGKTYSAASEAENTFVWTVTATEYENYDTNSKTLSGEVTLKNPKHSHKWVYSLEGTSTLKAHCTNPSCTETSDPALALAASDMIYSGYVYAGDATDTFNDIKITGYTDWCDTVGELVVEFSNDNGVTWSEVADTPGSFKVRIYPKEEVPSTTNTATASFQVVFPLTITKTDGTNEVPAVLDTDYSVSANTVSLRANNLIVSGGSSSDLVNYRLSAFLVDDFTLRNLYLKNDIYVGKMNTNQIITLVGQNQIGNKNSRARYGLYSDDPDRSIVVTGSGNLAIYDEYSGIKLGNKFDIKFDSNFTGKLTIDGGTEGGTCLERGKFIVENGTLNIASENEKGIIAKEIIVNGGTVIVQGGSQAMSVAPAIGTDMEVKVSSTNYDASNPVQYVETSIGDYKYLKIGKVHIHNWTYSVENNSTLKAHCTNEDCPETTDPTLVLTAPITLTYDNSAKAATLTDTDDKWAENIGSTLPTITYYSGTTKLDGAPVNTGIYTATVTYGGKTAKVTYAVEKAKVTIPAADTSKFTYDGFEKTYNIETSDLYTVSGNVKIEAGTYTVTVSLKDKMNYEWNGSNPSRDRTYTFVINKANSSLTAPVAKTDLVYTGSAQELVINGTTSDGTIVYGTNKYGPYLNVIPTAKNADEYTVWYKVKGDKSHDDSEPVMLTVTIAKAKVEAPKANETEFTYNGLNQIYKLETSALYTVTNNIRKNAGYQTVSVKLKDKANYTWSDGASIDKTYTFTIKQKEITVSGIKANDKFYDGTTDVVLDCSNVRFEGLVMGDRLSVKVEGSFVNKDVGNNKEVGIANIELLNASGFRSLSNYKLAESGNQTTAKANIFKKNITVAITVNGGTYGNVKEAEAKLIGTIKGDDIKPVIKYSGKEEVPTNAGTYVVTTSLKGEDADNYNLTGITTSVFTINKAKVSVPKADTTVYVYDGEEKAYKLAESKLYEVSNNKRTNAGSQTVTVSLKDKDNYTWEGLYPNRDRKYTFTVLKARLTASDFTYLEPEELTYDGTVKTATVTTEKSDGKVFVEYYKDGVKVAEAINAGTYVVKVRVSEGSNYYAVRRPIEVGTFTVKKAIPEYEVPTGLSADINTELTDIVLPEGFSFDEADITTVGNLAGEKVFHVKFTPADIENYEVVVGIGITIKVNPVLIEKEADDFLLVGDMPNRTYMELNTKDTSLHIDGLSSKDVKANVDDEGYKGILVMYGDHKLACGLDYKVTDGSVKVVLTKKYLDTLPVGTHYFKVYLKLNGVATTDDYDASFDAKVVITPRPEPAKPVPNTGTMSQNNAYMLASLLPIALVATLIAVKKKKDY